MMTYQLTLVCDKCGAMLASEQQADIDSKDLFLRAKTLGWRFPEKDAKFLDLCPDCIAKKREVVGAIVRQYEVK